MCVSAFKIVNCTLVDTQIEDIPYNIRNRKLDFGPNDKIVTKQAVPNSKLGFPFLNESFRAQQTLSYCITF